MTSTIFDASTQPFAWSAFDLIRTPLPLTAEHLAETLLLERRTALREHADYQRAAPPPDHFIPLLHLAGLASASKQPAQVLVEGYAFGSLSMTSYTLEASCPTDGGDRRPGASLPDPQDVPPEDANV